VSEYLKNCLVLLVEDDAIVAIDLEDSLRDGGYAVAGSFSTCAAATKWLETETPDLAVLDVMLSDGPCNELAAELSRRDVPFVVLSSKRQSRNTYEEFDGATWIEKPAAHDVVLKALAELQVTPQRKTDNWTRRVGYFDGRLPLWSLSMRSARRCHFSAILSQADLSSSLMLRSALRRHS